MRSPGLPAAPRTGKPGGKWSDLGLRFASAAILAPIALFALWRGGLAWELLIAAAMLGLAAEWSRLARLSRFNIAIFTGVFAPLALAGGLDWPAGLLALLLLTLVTAWRFGWFAGLGLPYICLGGFSLLWLRAQPEIGFRATLFLILVIWATDIGAYATGRLIGGAKLAPRISPGKTVSGSIGGLVIAAVSPIPLLSGGWREIAFAGLLAALLSISAQAGDLLESAIKRKLGVKDSGRTIPGHGGLFDRLDGFLAAAPVAVVIALAIHHGIIPGLQGVGP